MFKNNLVILQLPQLTQKVFLITVAVLLSSPVYAMSDLAPVIGNFAVAILKGAVMAIGFYLFPVVFGLLIVKKDRRSWFGGVSAAMYAVSLMSVVSMVQSGANDLTLLGLPYLLIPVAIYSRLKKTA